MGVELSKPGGPEDVPRAVGHDVQQRDLQQRDPRQRASLQVRREVEIIRPEDLEPHLGANLPVLGWVPDTAFQVVRFLGMGVWILLYASVSWEFGFIAMWAWIALNVAYENETRRQRRLRRHYRRAVKMGLAVPAASEGPAPVPGRVGRALSRPAPQAPRAVAPVAAEGSGTHGAPHVTRAEKALVATVRRVDTSDRFERTDVVLVHEVADLLGPLLLRIAERGGDPQVRHDLETLAIEHLPRTVDDFLALPADVVHSERHGTTPADDLRGQLHLLVEGCRQLRDSVLAADVDRQQQQSRFLETKFRRSDLDL